jgi:hypothetical protein
MDLSMEAVAVGVKLLYFTAVWTGQYELTIFDVQQKEQSVSNRTYMFTVFVGMPVYFYFSTVLPVYRGFSNCLPSHLHVSTRPAQLLILGSSSFQGIAMDQTASSMDLV